MRRHQIKLLTMVGLSGVWVLAGAGAAMAGTGDLIIDKIAFFNQTSSSPPATAVEWKFSATVLPANPIDIAAAELTPPGGSPLAIGPGALALSASYTSQAQLDAAFPDGGYAFQITSGSLSGGTASLTMPDNSFYPAEIPALSGSSFTALETYNPSQALPLSWDSFTPDARTTFPFVDFWIWDMSNQTTSFIADTSTNVSSFTSATIPASTLLPNHQYWASFVFENDVKTNNAYFGDYNTDILKEYYTDIYFTTVPEPSSGVLVGVAAAGLYVVARRRRPAKPVGPPSRAGQRQR